MNKERVFAYGFMTQNKTGTIYGSGIATTNARTLEEVKQIESDIKQGISKENGVLANDVVLTFLSEIAYEEMKCK